MDAFVSASSDCGADSGARTAGVASGDFPAVSFGMQELVPQTPSSADKEQAVTGAVEAYLVIETKCAACLSSYNSKLCLRQMSTC